MNFKDNLRIITRSELIDKLIFIRKQDDVSVVDKHLEADALLLAFIGDPIITNLFNTIKRGYFYRNKGAENESQ